MSSLRRHSSPLHSPRASPMRRLSLSEASPSPSMALVEAGGCHLLAIKGEAQALGTRSTRDTKLGVNEYTYLLTAVKCYMVWKSFDIYEILRS